MVFLTIFKTAEKRKKKVFNVYLCVLCCEINSESFIGRLAHARTAMRGWYSMFVAYWKHGGKGQLTYLMPTIEALLDQWEKVYEVTKAKSFTEDDLRK